MEHLLCGMWVIAGICSRGWSHGAFVATIEHPNADIGIGRCEPEQVQREQPPRQSCPDDGDPAHCFFVLAALGRPLESSGAAAAPAPARTGPPFLR